MIEASNSATIDGYPIAAGVTNDFVRGTQNVSGSNGYQFDYGVSFNSKAAVVSSAGMDGNDGGWAVLYGNDPVSPYSSEVNLAIDEDQIRDSERSHTTEQVAYFVIDPPEADRSDLNAVAELEETTPIVPLATPTVATQWERAPEFSFQADADWELTQSLRQPAQPEIAEPTQLLIEGSSRETWETPARPFALSVDRSPASIDRAFSDLVEFEMEYPLASDLSR